MNSKTKRFSSLFLAIILCLGLFPVASAANETAETTYEISSVIASEASLKVDYISTNSEYEPLQLEHGSGTLNNISGVISIGRVNSDYDYYGVVTITGTVKNLVQDSNDEIASIIIWKQPKTSDNNEKPQNITNNLIQKSKTPTEIQYEWHIGKDEMDYIYEVELLTKNGAKRSLYYTVSAYVQAAENAKATYRTVGMRVTQISGWNIGNDVECYIPLFDAEYIDSNAQAMLKSLIIGQGQGSLLDSEGSLTISGYRVVAVFNNNKKLLDYYSTEDYKKINDSYRGGTKVTSKLLSSAFESCSGTGGDTLASWGWGATNDVFVNSKNLTVSWELPTSLSVEGDFYMQEWLPELNDGKGGYDTTLVENVTYTGRGGAPIECSPYQTIMFTVANTNNNVLNGKLTDNYHYHGLVFKDSDNPDPSSGEKGQTSKSFFLSSVKDWGEVVFYWRDDTKKPDISIQVIDAETKEPIEGALVQNTLTSPAGVATLVDGTTDNGGFVMHYKIPMIADKQYYDFKASCEGYESNMGTATVIKDGDVSEVVIELMPIGDGIITVKIVDKNGTPVTETVTVTEDKTQLTETVTTSGETVYKDVPDGSYSFSASADGLVMDKRNPESVTIEGDEEKTVIITMKEDDGEPDIKVTVASKKTGATIPDANVNNSILGTGTTGADGIYTYVDVNNGTYEITASKDGASGKETAIVNGSDTAITILLDIGDDTIIPPPFDGNPGDSSVPKIDLLFNSFADKRSNIEYISGCDVITAVYFEGDGQDFYSVDLRLNITLNNGWSKTVTASDLIVSDGGKNIAVFKWTAPTTTSKLTGNMTVMVDSNRDYNEVDEYVSTTFYKACSWDGCTWTDTEVVNRLTDNEPTATHMHTWDDGDWYDNIPEYNEDGTQKLDDDGNPVTTSGWVSDWKTENYGYIDDWKHSYIDYGPNNDGSTKVTIVPLPTTTNGDNLGEKDRKPTPPSHDDNTDTHTWTEQYYDGSSIKTRTVSVTLTVNTELDYETKGKTTTNDDGIKIKDYLRSGYGYEIDVNAKVTASHTSAYTAAQLAYAYIPHLKNAYKYPLRLITANSGYDRHYTFEKNSESAYNNPKQFIPVWWPDTVVNRQGKVTTNNQNYVVQSYATAVYTPLGMLTAWGNDQSITVSGSMYDDDTVLIQ